MVNNPKIMRAMAYEREINRVQSIEREAEIESSCKLKYYK